MFFSFEHFFPFFILEEEGDGCWDCLTICQDTQKVIELLAIYRVKSAPRIRIIFLFLFFGQKGIRVILSCNGPLHY